jgi:transcriptional regulator with XRE-family HTH domain
MATTRTDKSVKSVDRGEYAIAWALLRSARLSAKLTQRQLAVKLGRTQTFVADVELGRRRLDILQLYDWCKATGTPLAAYAQQVESTLDVLPKHLPTAMKARKARQSVK